MTTYGLQLPKFTFTVPDDRLFEHVAAMATAADDGGFTSLWVMDHFYQLPGLGGADDKMLEGYTLLGALAARTQRVTLGTLVTGVTYRNPALLAKEVTTLDIISSGRAVLGIGAAWYDVEHEGLGVDFPPAGERLSRLEEAVQICRAMFREERPTFEGRYYRIREAVNIPRPVQAGGPPIMIGGGGEKRTLRLVARYADMCNLFGDADAVRHKLAVLRQHCEDVGRDLAEITVSRLATAVMKDSDDELVDEIEQLRDAGVDYFIFNLPTQG